MTPNLTHSPIFIKIRDKKLPVNNGLNVLLNIFCTAPVPSIFRIRSRFVSSDRDCCQKSVYKGTQTVRGKYTGMEINRNEK